MAHNAPTYQHPCYQPQQPRQKSRNNSMQPDFAEKALKCKIDQDQFVTNCSDSNGFLPCTTTRSLATPRFSRNVGIQNAMCGETCENTPSLGESRGTLGECHILTGNIRLCGQGDVVRHGEIWCDGQSRINLSACIKSGSK